MDDKTLEEKFKSLDASIRNVGFKTLMIIAGGGILAGIYTAKIDRIEEYVHPVVHAEDVIGKSAPEKFYEIDGQRVYLEIDGRPIEEYFSRQ